MFGNAVKQYFGEFGRLRECPREFWVANLINFLDSLGYFAVIFIMALFFTQSLNIADDTSQFIVGGYLAGITLVTLFAGFIVDALGLKKSMLMAFGFVALGRGLLGWLGIDYIGVDPEAAFTQTNLLYTMLGLLAIGQAFIQPTLTAAFRRYTDKQTRSSGFNFWYLSMQLGAIAALFILDAIRFSVGNYSLFIVGAIAAVLSWLAALLIRNEDQMGGDEEGALREKRNPFLIAWEVMRETKFWRFILFIVILFGVRMTFAYAYVVNPKYYTRILGDDALIGSLSNLNPIIITIGLILIVPYLKKLSVFKSMLVGMTITALSLFMLALPVSCHSFIGVEVKTWYYIIIIGQIVVFAVGEFIWSPRFQDYVSTVAPKGREATYFGFAMLPTFVSKMLTGVISGFFLVRYCPEKGLMESIIAGELDYWHSPEAMWFWFGVIAISSPIVLMMVRKIAVEDMKPAED